MAGTRRWSPEIEVSIGRSFPARAFAPGFAPCPCRYGAKERDGWTRTSTRPANLFAVVDLHPWWANQLSSDACTICGPEWDGASANHILRHPACAPASVPVALGSLKAAFDAALQAKEGKTGLGSRPAPGS